MLYLRFDRVVAMLAALVGVGLPLLLLAINKNISEYELDILRVVVSLSAAALGATLPGFLNVNLSGGGLTIRAGAALTLFTLSFVYTPVIFSKFDLTSYIKSIFAVLGFGSFFVVFLSAVATSSLLYIFEIRRLKSDLQLKEDLSKKLLERVTSDPAPSEDDIEKLMSLLKGVEKANISIQAQLLNRDGKPNTIGG